MPESRIEKMVRLAGEAFLFIVGLIYDCILGLYYSWVGEVIVLTATVFVIAFLALLGIGYLVTQENFETRNHCSDRCAPYAPTIWHESDDTCECDTLKLLR